MRRLAAMALGILLVLGLAGLAGAEILKLPSPRLVYALVQADATTDTLIAVTRVDDNSGALGGILGSDPLPLHLNFFDKDCLVRDREDALTPLDVDVYVYSGFATGIPKGAAEVHVAIPGFLHGQAFGSGTQSLILIGEAVILNFDADTMVGYSASGIFPSDTLDYNVGSFADTVAGVPHFLAEVPGILTNEIALAAVPCDPTQNCDGLTLTDVDTYPSASSDLFTVRWRMFDGNEEEASATSTWKCVLHASLSSIFGPITTLGLLPADEQGGPRILFYPYGWVRAAIEFAPTALDVDNWAAVGIFRQQYTDGTFSWGEATNLWDLLFPIPSIDGPPL